MAHRRPGRIVHAGPRRLTQWVGPAQQEFVAVASAGATLIASFDAEAQGFPRPTLVRTRGEVSIRASAYNADLNIVGAFGMCVVSDQAFAAGVASVPEPFTDAGWNGWFVWQSFNYVIEHSTDVGKQAPADRVYQVDSKAMRKIAENETVVLVCESFVGALTISMPVRMLIKLS